ncbi:MAG: hypothetical protein AAGA93_28175, partial [Actinomycetota bacterium]
MAGSTATGGTGDSSANRTADNTTDGTAGGSAGGSIGGGGAAGAAGAAHGAAGTVETAATGRAERRTGRIATAASTSSWLNAALAVQSLAVGAVMALIALSYNIVYASLIYRGDLADAFPTGLGANLLATAVAGVLIAVV